MKFKIIARAGFDTVPLLIIEEEIVAIIEAKNKEDLAKKLGGEIIRLEGEDCIFIPEIPKFLQGNQKFLHWWKKATLVKIGEKNGKLFIVKA